MLFEQRPSALHSWFIDTPAEIVVEGGGEFRLFAIKLQDPVNLFNLTQHLRGGLFGDASLVARFCRLATHSSKLAWTVDVTDNSPTDRASKEACLRRIKKILFRLGMAFILHETAGVSIDYAC